MVPALSGSGGPTKLARAFNVEGVACTPIQIDSFTFAKCGIQPMPGLSLVVGQPSHALLARRTALNAGLLFSSTVVYLPGKPAHTNLPAAS